jgi:hypothetical protein
VSEVGGAAGVVGAAEPAAPLGRGCAAAICGEPGWGRAPASLGSGSRNALRKATSESLRYPAEAPDVEEEAWPAGGAEGAEEATLDAGGTDDAGGADEAGETDDAAVEDGAGEADGAGAAVAAADEDDAGEPESPGAAVDGGEVDGTEETEEVDDSGKREKEEHAARIGISVIAAATAPKGARRPRLATRLRPPIR